MNLFRLNKQKRFIVQVTGKNSVEMTLRTTRTMNTDNVRNTLVSISSLCLTLDELHSLEQLMNMAGSLQPCLQPCNTAINEEGSTFPQLLLEDFSKGY